MLYLISTPIGNLGDLTYRAVETLQKLSLVLAEDTRVSERLLRHYEIRVPMKSFHQFSEKKEEEGIIQRLKRGDEIGLISDAGTPLVSDPGHRLVRRCREEGIPVTALPGPSSVIQALVLSGLSPERFQFVGFLPRTKEAFLKEILGMLDYPGTSICFESPERVMKAVEALAKLAPEREITLARELTKKFEEVLTMPSKELLDQLVKTPPRGEIVLLISGSETPDWSQLSPQEHVAMLSEEFSLKEGDAIKLAAYLRHTPKRLLYRDLKINLD